MEGCGTPLLSRLRNQLSPLEIEIILELRKVVEHGWGSLAISVKRGKIATITPAIEKRPEDYPEE